MLINLKERVVGNWKKTFPWILGFERRRRLENK